MKYEPTLITWVLVVYGLITCIPLLVVQFLMLINPNGTKTREVLIGKGEDWRDNSHFKSAYGLAITDWLIFLPFFILAIVGIFLSEFWGLVFLGIAGAIQVYINVFLWFFEKEYVYPTNGPLKYYTYLWGNFIYWGIGSVVNSVIQ